MNRRTSLKKIAAGFGASFKEKLHIINGLHGKHTSPAHSAFFGALGGYRGSGGVPPSASTIDYELSKVLPQTLLPHLCIGMDSLDNMKAKPTVANLSARGAGNMKPIPPCSVASKNSPPKKAPISLPQIRDATANSHKVLTT